jgi:hypothetical protein
LGVEKRTRADADCNQEAFYSAFYVVHGSLTTLIYRTGDATTSDGFPSPANDKSTMLSGSTVKPINTFVTSTGFRYTLDFD